MKPFFAPLLLAFAVLLQIRTATASPDLFDQRLTVVSALPGNPFLQEQHDERCVVTWDPKAKPLAVRLVPGLKNRKYVSLEIAGAPGTYLRHYGGVVYATPCRDGDGPFRDDATFKLILSPNGTYAFESLNLPTGLLTVLPSGTLIVSSDSDPLNTSFLLKPADGAGADPERP